LLGLARSQVYDGHEMRLRQLEERLMAGIPGSDEKERPP
jgi:hypothetical protein